MVVVELLVEELVVLAARENHTMVCFRLNLEDTLWKTNISWLEYPHVQKKQHLQKGPILHCYVSLPECDGSCLEGVTVSYMILYA